MLTSGKCRAEQRVSIPRLCFLHFARVVLNAPDKLTVSDLLQISNAFVLGFDEVGLFFECGFVFAQCLVQLCYLGKD